MIGVDLFLRGLDVDGPWALSEDEQARAARFRFEKDRRRYSACRGMLREILAEYTGVRATELRFAYNQYGKPSVGGIHFNVSHSGGMAAIAVSRTREVGVDIELVQPRFAQEQVPERFFSPGEVSALRSLPPGDQVEAFFRCWTRKEAYVKARGLGLSLALDSFDVSLGSRAEFLRGVEGWSVEAIEVGPGFVGALVATDNPAGS